jgi:predicted ATP-grasp superfamily ATP-dependent carboligase
LSIRRAPSRILEESSVQEFERLHGTDPPDHDIEWTNKTLGDEVTLEPSRELFKQMETQLAVVPEEDDYVSIKRKYKQITELENLLSDPNTSEEAYYKLLTQKQIEGAQQGETPEVYEKFIKVAGDLLDRPEFSGVRVRWASESQ